MGGRVRGRVRAGAPGPQAALPGGRAGPGLRYLRAEESPPAVRCARYPGGAAGRDGPAAAAGDSAEAAATAAAETARAPRTRRGGAAPYDLPRLTCCFSGAGGRRNLRVPLPALPAGVARAGGAVAERGAGRRGAA